MISSPATRRRYVILPALLLGLLALRPSCAYACSCVMPPPPAEARQQADAVFIGRASQTGEAPGRPMFSDEFPFVDWGNEFAGPRTTFVVSAVLKGRVPAEVVVDTSQTGGACGYAFVVGQEYIVYAFRGEAGLSTSICTRSNTLADAQQDLAELGPGRPPDREVLLEDRPRSSATPIILGALLLLALSVAAAWGWRRRTEAE